MQRPPEVVKSPGSLPILPEIERKGKKPGSPAGRTASGKVSPVGPGVMKVSQVKYMINNETSFSMKLFLEQLVYTSDLSDKQEAIKMVCKGDLTIELVENYLACKVKEYLQSNFR